MAFYTQGSVLGPNDLCFSFYVLLILFKNLFQVELNVSTVELIKRQIFSFQHRVIEVLVCHTTQILSRNALTIFITFNCSMKFVNDIIIVRVREP